MILVDGGRCVRFVAALLGVVMLGAPDVSGRELLAVEAQGGDQSTMGDGRQVEAGLEFPPAGIRPGDTATTPFCVKSGRFVRWLVDQRGCDVRARLVDPNGRVLADVDTPQGDQGFEEVLAITETEGCYELEITALGGSPPGGTYQVRVDAYRQPERDDRALVDADRAFWGAREVLLEGGSERALESLGESLATFDRLERDDRAAACLREMARAHRGQARYELAAVLSGRAATRFAMVGDRLQAATAAVRSGYDWLTIGLPHRALPPLREGLSLHRELGRERSVALAASYLGTAYHRLGWLQASLDVLEEARVAAEASGDPLAQALAASELGGVYLALGRSQDAASAFHSANDHYRRLDRSTSRPSALLGLGQAALQAGDLEEAESFLREAERLLPETAPARLVGNVYRTLGNLERQRSRFGPARSAFDTAVKKAQSVHDVWTEAAASLQWGYLEVVAGYPERGLELLARAGECYERAGDSRGQASVSAWSGYALGKLGRPEEGLQRLEAALSTIEAVRSETLRRDYRMDYFGSRQAYYEIGIELHLALHASAPDAGHARRALQLNERRVARELVEQLTRMASVEPAPTDEELELERALADAAIESGDGGQAAVTDLIGQLHAHRRRPATSAAEGAVFHTPEPADLESLQQSLKAGEVVLVFALAKESSTLWRLDAECLEVFRLPARAVIERAAGAFSRNVAKRHPSVAKPGGVLSGELAESLRLAAACESGCQRLVIVADGALGGVPFAALPSLADPQRFLIEDVEIVRTPSLSTLAALRKRPGTRWTGGPTVAAFADPVFGERDSRLAKVGGAPGVEWGGGSAEASRTNARSRAAIERSTREMSLDIYRRLPHSRTEAESIVGLIPDRDHLLALGFDADREAVLELTADRFQVLHLATHAFVDPHHPELSGLVMSLVRPNGAARRGVLYAHEVSRSKFPFELVVLSACETGLGGYTPGEGTASLARAFLQAGARRVVATSWQVSDRSSAVLMVRFYSALLVSGTTTSSALRSAQLETLGEAISRHPYYWAGFALQGEWRPLIEPPPASP